MEFLFLLLGVSRPLLCTIKRWRLAKIVLYHVLFWQTTIVNPHWLILIAQIKKRDITISARSYYLGDKPDFVG